MTFELVTGELPHYRWEHGAASAIFTMREGGVSGGAYAALNLGLHVGDDAAAVAANRRRVLDTAGVREARAADQVHGIAVVEDPADEWGDRPASRQADALVTSQTGLGLVVMVADCVPIVLAGKERVAVIHAGWRGLVAGVVEAAIAGFGEPPERAAVGPSIGPCCFAVGVEVADAFPATVVRRSDTSATVDLRAEAQRRLELAAVPTDVLDLCTSCDERFFSHRRQGGTAGRQAVLAWTS